MARSLYRPPATQRWTRHARDTRGARTASVAAGAWALALATGTALADPPAQTQHPQTQPAGSQRAPRPAQTQPAPAQPAQAQPAQAQPAPATPPSQPAATTSASPQTQPATPAGHGAAPATTPHPGHQPLLTVTSGTVDHTDYTTPRYEPAGFPLVAGDTDIGVLFGAAGTLTRFENGVRPYRWNMDLVLSASVKGGPTGVEIAQQNYLWNWDIPGLLHDRLRLNVGASFNRTINAGYFGLGNASDGQAPASVAGERGRFFQFIDTQFRLRGYARVRLLGPLSLMFGGIYRFNAPEAYAGSRLAIDAMTQRADGSPWIYGTGPTHLGEVTAGAILDTRDNEIAPLRGMYYQLGVRYVQGFPFDSGVRYAAVSGSFAHYIPIAAPLTFAFRVLADFQFGNVPFYDAYMGGPFNTCEMVGGSNGVRGVPVGRYLGPIKIVANAELRASLFGFSIARQQFRLGANAFFDAGRVWSDYSFHSPLDGSGIGIKYGVGGGLNLRWGQAAIFRVEAAYSPDAVSENPGFPVGIYVEDGVMF